MSPGLRADILRIIPERISEIFLLVSLNIDIILGGVTISERRQKLNELAKGSHLVDAYATTLTRMKAQKGSRSKLGMEALMWVSNSERPLHTTELCHALGVKIGSADLDVENVPTIRTLLACALGLITVETSTSTVQLIHFSLQEYLFNNPSLFQSPHSMIAEVCLTYLDFRSVRELSPALSSDPPTLPLVGYASGYWGKHVKKGGAGSVPPLALKLLLEFDQHISSHLLLLQYFKDERFWELGFDKKHGLKGFTGLHGAAFFGMVDILAMLLANKGWDINATDTMGRTALAWAAIGGHEDVAAIILQQKDAKADTADTGHGLAPLWLATVCGHEGVVKLLLKREDIDPNTPDTEYGAAPLLLAAWGGLEGVVKLLLEREDINPNTADTEYRRMPLWWTAMSGHERIAKLLLKREDINPNSADSIYGRTPLLLAAKNGNEEIVKLLLERDDVNPNATDTEYGWAPLLLAAKNGHEGVVKLLLERDDVNPHILNFSGETAPQLAASSGHTGVAQLLLAPKPSLSVPVDIDKVPERPLSDPSDLPQSPPRQSLPSASLPPDTRPLLGKTIGSFMIISSFLFIFYFLAIVSPSLSSIILPSFHR